MTTSPRKSKYSNIKPKERLPSWLTRPIGNVSQIELVQSVVKRSKLHTICEEGRCPNRGECYASGTATFLLGGSICTRSCAFCQVDKGKAPNSIDPLEAQRVAEAVHLLKLRYVVITSVARDDLDDHGASLFTKAMEAIRQKSPSIAIEVLTPDFWGGFSDLHKNKQAQSERLSKVLQARPICFNHNIETVKRLQKEVRRGATYERSLELLKKARRLAPSIPTKSGLMLGLGESCQEIVETLKDLRKVDCQQITLGQYLRPSLAHIPVQKYWTPKEFEGFRKLANDLGFIKVRSGPLVRSSFHAEKD